MKVIYIGGFPPPYGGVTTKNNYLYIALREKIEIRKIDFNSIKRGNLIEAIKLMVALVGRKNNFVVGVAGKKTRKMLCKLLYYINRKAMGRSVIFLMGGTAANDIANDRKYQKYISHFRRIYAETHGMIETLKSVGFSNADYYPNCRRKPRKEEMNAEETTQMKCAFFSSKIREQYAEIVLDAAARLPERLFSFYGSVDEKYRSKFISIIKRLPNTSYYGSFYGNTNEAYHELAQFDSLLFPLGFNFEETSGLSIDSANTTIICIANGNLYTSETEKTEEYVYNATTIDELVTWLSNLQNNPEGLAKQWKNLLKTTNHCIVDKYINQMIKQEIGEQCNRQYQLNTVFFARVCLDKGIDIVLDTAKMLPEIAFHIYGPIAEDSFDIVYEAVHNLKNVFYHGVFRDKDEALYNELSKYDTVLLPTRWASEGVPGILAESKIAGIPAVVSNVCYNAEIIHNELDGIILQDNSKASLANALRILSSNAELLEKLKQKAKEDAKSYFVESFIEDITKVITDYKDK